MNLNRIYNPQIKILLNNSNLVDSQGLYNINIISCSSKPSVCEISFINNISLNLDIEDIKQELKILLGNSTEPLFHGFITASEFSINSQGDYIYHIRAYDSLINLTKTQNISGIHRKNLKEIINICDSSIKLKNHNLLTDFKWRNLFPFQECDLDFIARISAQIGLYFHLRNSHLHFYTLDEKKSENKVLNINEDILEISVKRNSLSDIDNVSATSWDLQELNILKTKTKNRNDLIIHELLSNDKNEINKKANARLQYNKALSKIIEGTILGASDIYPGKKIIIKGLNNNLSGIVNRVEHSIDSNKGFTTKFTTEPVQIVNRIKSLNGTIAQVTNINDPENKGRIKVKLPSMGNYETDWLPLMIPGGGKGHGVVFFPSPGDLIYLSFLNGDITKGIVLGGIPGLDNNGLDEFSLLIDKDQSIKVNKKKKSIKIENNGSRLEMSKNKLELFSKENIDIKAPSKTINITGQNINFIKG